ncbi:MAG: TRAP transporter small permease [Deltaproteobacteria bacterium]|nr:TRAP transporter small permease [Deltaproteobacteria bacterium]
MMPFLRRAFRLGGLLHLASLVAVAGVFCIMLLTTADVVGRYLLLKPIAGAVEASTFLLVLVVSLGFGFAQLQRRHVYLELFVSRFPRRVQRALEVPLLLCALAIFVAMTWASAGAAYSSRRQGEYWFSTLRFPVWPVRFVVFLGLLLLCLQLGSEILRKLTGRRRE